MPRRSGPDALAQEARFVFKGTVKKLRAATMREVPIDARTVVVRVDDVIQAPEAMSHYAGQDITVLLPAKKKVKKGQQSVFYTNGLLFGDSVAVQAVDHHEVEKIPAALALASGGDPVRNLAVKDVQARVSSADVIVSGRVTSVRVPSDPWPLDPRLPRIQRPRVRSVNMIRTGASARSRWIRSTREATRDGSPKFGSRTVRT